MPPRLLLIVLDGHEQSLAEELMRAGDLPAMAALRARSRRWPLDHGAARRTGLAGEHIATGLDPDAARRWSAIHFDSARYRVEQVRTAHAPFTAGLDIRTTVFDAPYFDLSRAGEAVGLVAWGAHDPGVVRMSRPEGLAEEVRARFGAYPGRQWTYGFAWPSPAKTAAMAEGLRQAVEQRAAIAEWLLAERLPDWQLGIVVVGETHSANEALWHGIDPTHPLHRLPSAAAAGEGIREVLRAVDRLVGRLTARFPDALLALAAPHGMGANNADVPSMLLLPEAMHRYCLGRPAWEPRASWAQAEGPPLLGEEESWEEAVRACFRLPRPWLERLLAGRRRPPAGLTLTWMPASWYQPAWPAMRAFAVPSYYDGQIRVNLRGREGQGTVAAADYAATCDEIEAFLLACRDPRSGEPAVEAVDRTAGDPLRRPPSAPDLTVLWRGAALALQHPKIGTVGPAPYRRTGGHTGGDGLFWLAGEGIDAGEETCASTFDLVPTLVRLLGLEPAAAMSGRALVDRPPLVAS